MLQRNLTLAGLLIGLFLFSSQAVKAQSDDPPRYEVGAQFTLLRLVLTDETNIGGGGRFTFNLNKHIALESEFNYVPGGRVGYNQKRFQTLFGVKAGIRRKDFGLFGKLRPGVLRFNQSTPPSSCPSLVPNPLPCPQTNFALDVGGVAEFYPSRRTLIRFDLGDTLTRYERIRTISTPVTSVVQEYVFSHNLQLSVGFGLRF